MSRQPRMLCGNDRTDRRQQILDAAQRCFKIHGFHRTTLRDIAREFGMSVGHIYNYFSNKEAIIEALVETQTQRFIDMLDAGTSISTSSPKSVFITNSVPWSMLILILTPLSWPLPS